MRFRFAAGDFAKKPRQRDPNSVAHQHDQYQQDKKEDETGDEIFHVRSGSHKTPQALDNSAQGNTLGKRAMEIVFAESDSEFPTSQILSPLQGSNNFSGLENPGWRASRLPWAIIFHAFSVKHSSLARNIVMIGIQCLDTEKRKDQTRVNAKRRSTTNLSGAE